MFGYRIADCSPFSIELQIDISPEVSNRALNRAIISELRTRYGKSSLANRNLAYDGKKSMYTAGALPFSFKDFVIKLSDRNGRFASYRVFYVLIFFYDLVLIIYIYILKLIYIYIWILKL